MSELIKNVHYILISEQHLSEPEEESLERFLFGATVPYIEDEVISNVCWKHDFEAWEEGQKKYLL